MSTINFMMLATMFVITIASCLYAVTIAKKADRCEARLHQMTHSYWNAYRDLADGKTDGETLDNLMENIDIILKY